MSHKFWHISRTWLSHPRQYFGLRPEGFCSIIINCLLPVIQIWEKLGQNANPWSFDNIPTRCNFVPSLYIFFAGSHFFKSVAPSLPSPPHPKISTLIIWNMDGVVEGGWTIYTAWGRVVKNSKDSQSLWKQTKTIKRPENPPRSSTPLRHKDVDTMQF